MNALTIFNLDENFVEMITHIYLQTRRSRCEYAIEKWVKRRSPQLVLNLVVLIRTPPMVSIPKLLLCILTQHANMLKPAVICKR